MPYVTPRLIAEIEPPPVVAEVPAYPSFRSVSTIVGSVGDLNLSLPAGIEDDDWLLLHLESSNQSFSGKVASPWSLISSIGSGTGGTAGSNRQEVWGARASAVVAAGAPALVVTDPGNFGLGFITAWKDCKTGSSPVNVVSTPAGAGYTTTHGIQGVTTTVDNCRVIGMISLYVDGSDGYTNRAGPATNSNMIDLGKTTEGSTSQGNGGCIAVYDGVLEVAGSSGSFSGITTPNSNAMKLSLALEPRQ